MEDREPLNPSTDFPSYTRFLLKQNNIFESLGMTSIFYGWRNNLHAKFKHLAYFIALCPFEVPPFLLYFSID